MSPKKPSRAQWKSAIIGSALAVAACNPETELLNPDLPQADPDFPGVLDGENQAPLTSLTCTFVNNVMTVTLVDDTTAIISKRVADNAILVNGATCGSPAALSSTAKKLTLTNSSGANSVIIDYLNGAFLPGSASGVGIDAAGLTSADSFSIRGTRTADAYTIGLLGMTTDADTNRDILYGAAAITLTTGQGNDVISAQGSAPTGGAYASPLTIYAGEGNDTITGGDGVDTIYGGDGNDTIRGMAGADVLRGEGGDDTFDEGTDANGADTFHGGGGTDTVSYANRTGTGVTALINGAAASGKTGATENDTIQTDVEVLTGSALADVLTGGSGNDTLNGLAGNDTLTGGTGDDILNGGDGDDSMVAGATADGADVFNGGAGTDTVTYAARSAGVTVTIDGTNNDGETGAAEGDNVKADVENLIGGGGNDVLTGSASNNVFTGGAGNDTINGLAGDDTFIAGASDGNDVFDGGAGVDTADYSARSAALTVTMAADADDGATGETDDINATVENFLCGTGTCTVTGNALNNKIVGAAAAVNTLVGGAGDDELLGGSADDVLTGEAGDDFLDGNGGDDTLDCGAGDGDIGIAASTVTNAPVGCELNGN